MELEPNRKLFPDLLSSIIREWTSTYQGTLDRFSIGLGWSYLLWIDISLYTSLIGVTQYPWMHRPGISVLRPSSWMNPNFWTLGTGLEPSAMERLDGEQEPNEKIHGGVFTGASSLWPLNINIGQFFGFVI